MSDLTRTRIAVREIVSDRLMFRNHLWRVAIFVEREPLRDLEPAPSRSKRLIHGFRGLGLVRRCKVIAAREVDTYVLEEQRPERNAWLCDIRGIGRYRSMNRQQFQIRGDVCATRR